MGLYCACGALVLYKQETAYDLRINDWSSDVCSSDLKGKRQLVYYTPGVGTVGRVDFLYRTKQKFLGVLGLAMGYGLDDNVLGAYRFLVENWEEGDRTYLFGFSRGAWTARVLAKVRAVMQFLQQTDRKSTRLNSSN